VTEAQAQLRKAPRVTVVTPTFNQADLLPLTARSVCDQTWRDLEYLILDDGSTGDTAAVMRQLRDPRVACLRHENRGEAATTNRGWAMARGAYFAILSSDDLVKPRWLECMVRFMDENPDILVAYPDHDIIDLGGSVMQVVAAPDYRRDAMIAAFHPFPGVGAVIRRDALRDLHALRNPEYRYAPDLDSWLRLSLRGRFARLPDVLGSWRQHGGSITVAERSRRRAVEILRIAHRFFTMPDLPREVARLRVFGLAQAHDLASWIVRDTRPLTSALYLRRSHAISPREPDFIPRCRSRGARPDNSQILRLLGNSLRHRSVSFARRVGRRLARAAPSLPCRPPAATPPLPQDTGPSVPAVLPALPIPAPDPVRQRIAVLSPTTSLLHRIRERAARPAMPAIAQVTGRIPAAMPNGIDHLLVVPWVRGIGGSETMTDRLIEALRRHHGDDGLFILAPDASCSPAALTRHRGLPFLGLSDIDASLDDAARVEIFDRVMIQRRPKVAHAVNSLAAWGGFRDRARSHAANSALFAAAAETPC